MEDENEVRRQGHCNPRSILYLMSVGFASVAGPETSLLGFQTSMGVKKALGSTNVLIYGLIFLFCSLVIYAPLVKLWGRKVTLVVGELASITYTIAWYYPTWGTLIPAAVLLGIAEALIWPVSAAIAASLTGTEDSAENENKKRENLSIYIAILALGQALSYVIAEGIFDSLNSTTTNASSIAAIGLNITQCGSNDCPIRYAFSNGSAIFKNLIPSRVSVWVLLSVYLVIQLAGTGLHIAFVPNDKTTTVADPNGNEKNALIGVEEEKTFIQAIKLQLSRVGRQIFSVRGALVIPAQFQYGLLTTFIWSEFNRAFVACPIGVEHVGSCASVIDFLSFGTCAIITLISDRVGLPCIYVAALVMETISYTSALLWIPTMNSLYVPYLLAVVFGISHGMRTNVAITSAAVYFNDLDVSYTIQYATFSTRVILTYAWANLVCVFIKLYFILGQCALSTMLLLLAHFRFRQQTA